MGLKACPSALLHYHPSCLSEAAIPSKLLCAWRLSLIRTLYITRSQRANASGFREMLERWPKLRVAGSRHNCSAKKWARHGHNGML